MKSQRSRQKWKRAILYTGGFMCQHNRNLNDLGELYRSSTTTGGKQDATTINLVTRFHFISKGIKGTFFFLILRLCPLFFFLSLLLLLSVGTAHNALFYKVSMEAREKRCYVGWFPANSIHTRQLFLRTDKVLQSRALSLLWLLSSLVFPLLRSAASFFFTTRWEENKKKKSISCRPIVVVTLELSFHLTLRCATLVKEEEWQKQKQQHR